MKRPGSKAKLVISSVAMTVQRASLRINGAEVRVDNTEGEAGNEDFDDGEEGAEARIGDVKGGTLSISQATFNDQRSPWAGPISLAVNSYVAIKFYPSGLTGPYYYDWANCLVRSSTHEIMVPGGQPVSFELATDGLSDSLEPIVNPDAA